MLLPVNIDSQYVDDDQDPSVKLHQQHHDMLHAAFNDLMPAVVRSADAWSTSKDVLGLGQLGITAGTGELRAGNGADLWRDLPPGYDAGKELPPSSLTMQSSDYGVKGDGKTDDTASFQDFLNLAASLGLVARLAPSSNVKLTSAVRPPSGTVLDLNGSCITNASSSASGRLITLSGVSDIQIMNGVLDGNKSDYASATEQRHNLHIVNSSNVVCRDLLSKNAKGDGIYVGDNLSGPSVDIAFYNVTVTGCHRNGESITAGRNIHHFGCHFVGNGGTSPSAGVDIEPNTNAADVDTITFSDCIAEKNLGPGFLIQGRSATTTGRQGNVTLTGCSSLDNSSDGVYLRYVTNVQWLGGEVRGNDGRGFNLRDTCVNLLIDASIVGNGQEGIAQLASETTDVITDLVIRGYIWGNGTSQAAGTFDGANLAGGGVRLKFDATSGGRQQRYGLRTMRTWSQVSVGSGARFPENFAAAKASLADDFGSRTVLSGDLGWRLGRPLLTDVAMATRVGGDTVDRFSFRQDGRLQWSSGAALVDVTFGRTAAGTVGVGAANTIRTGRGTSAARPGAAIVGIGATWFDATLGKPIWSNGVAWVDATGRRV